MRVAIINPPLAGHEMRGTGVYTQNLIASIELIPGVEVISSEVTHLPRNVDLIHFPYFDPFFLTLPFFRGKKSIVTIHDLIPIKYAQHFPRGIKGEIKWQIQRFIARQTDAIITDSRASAEDIVTFIGIEKTKIFRIPLAPSPQFLKSKDKSSYEHIREKYHLPNKFVLYVGDMNWNKNVSHIIEAITEVKVPLVIVSKSFVERHDTSYNPWKESLLEAQMLAKNNQLIHKIGHIPQEELIGLYKLAACLVFPSFYEGFGLPVVEAFATGCPVVSSSGGSLAEIVGDAAYIVDPAEVKTIVEGIKEILTNAELKRQLVSKGYKQVKKFTWSKTAAETANVYKSVLNTP